MTNILIFRSKAGNVSDYDYYWTGKQIAFKLVTDESKSACVLDRNTIKFLDTFSNGTFKYVLLGEQLISDFYGFALPKNFYLNYEFNRRLVQLLEFGIIKQIFDLYLRFYKATGWKHEAKQPEVLHFEHLKFWFQIWFFLSMFSFLIFLFEKLGKQISSSLRFSHMSLEKCCQIFFRERSLKKKNLKVVRNSKKSVMLKSKKAWE